MEVFNIEFEFLNNYYLKTREDGAILDAFSDGPHNGRSTEGYTLFGQGGYQLRFTIDGTETEENPTLYTIDGIPLYRWDGESIHQRTEAEIAADRAAIPDPLPSPMEQLQADRDFYNIIIPYLLEKVQNV